MHPHNVQRVFAHKIRSTGRILNPSPSRKWPSDVSFCARLVSPLEKSMQFTNCSTSLCLEEQNGAVTEVEVNEVLCFCRSRVSECVLGDLHCRDGSVWMSQRGHPQRRGTVPWVTKLPKLRPTMQCHVGPFRSSNVFLMCCAISCHHAPSATVSVVDECLYEASCCSRGEEAEVSRQ